MQQKNGYFSKKIAIWNFMEELPTILVVFHLDRSCFILPNQITPRNKAFQIAVPNSWHKVCQLCRIRWGVWLAAINQGAYI